MNINVSIKLDVMTLTILINSLDLKKKYIKMSKCWSKAITTFIVRKHLTIFVVRIIVHNKNLDNVYIYLIVIKLTLNIFMI